MLLRMICVLRFVETTHFAVLVNVDIEERSAILRRDNSGNTPYPKIKRIKGINSSSEAAHTGSLVIALFICLEGLECLAFPVGCSDFVIRYGL